MISVRTKREENTVSLSPFFPPAKAIATFDHFWEKERSNFSSSSSTNEFRDPNRKRKRKTNEKNCPHKRKYTKGDKRENFVLAFSELSQARRQTRKVDLTRCDDHLHSKKGGKRRKGVSFWLVPQPVQLNSDPLPANPTKRMQQPANFNLEFPFPSFLGGSLSALSGAA